MKLHDNLFCLLRHFSANKINALMGMPKTGYLDLMIGSQRVKLGAVP